MFQIKFCFDHLQFVVLLFVFYCMFNLIKHNNLYIIAILLRVNVYSIDYSRMYFVDSVWPQ